MPLKMIFQPKLRKISLVNVEQRYGGPAATVGGKVLPNFGPKNSLGRPQTRLPGVRQQFASSSRCSCSLLPLEWSCSCWCRWSCRSWPSFRPGPAAELAEPPVRGLPLAYFAQPQFPADAAASAGLPPTAGPEDQAALLQGERVGERRRCNRALCWVVE